MLEYKIMEPGERFELPCEDLQYTAKPLGDPGKKSVFPKYVDL